MKSILSDIKVSPLLSSGQYVELLVLLSAHRVRFTFLWVSEQTAIIYFPVPHELKTGPGPTQPPVQWVSGPLPGGKAAGTWC